MKFFVSRQIYWGVEPEDSHTVEIAQGGRDYANPDMLVPKYAGEGEEYTDPIKAVEAALEIAEQWRKACPDKTINIAHGCTGGNTLPFEGDEVARLKAWAQKLHESLPRCAKCGEILDEKETYTLLDDPFEDKFCSEHCAEETYAERLAENDAIEEEVA
jgi:hypothetical protein